jgi:hypothetical protein
LRGGERRGGGSGAKGKGRVRANGDKEEGKRKKWEKGKEQRKREYIAALSPDFLNSVFIPPQV